MKMEHCERGLRDKEICNGEKPYHEQKYWRALKLRSKANACFKFLSCPICRKLDDCVSVPVVDGPLMYCILSTDFT